MELALEIASYCMLCHICYELVLIVINNEFILLRFSRDLFNIQYFQYHFLSIGNCGYVT